MTYRAHCRKREEEMMDSDKKELDDIITNKLIRTVFQPIVSLKDGSVLGYEALSRIARTCRFENPEELFVTAGVFSRLWDLELLCRTSALEAAFKFMISPYHKRLFLNVNPNIMHDESFKRGFTKEFLKRYGIAPENVIFEITERNVIEDMAEFRFTVSHYKSQEFRIAIDDTGAGYSGLNLISDVNPDYIKLDMKLIRNIDADRLKRALVKGMVEFSRASGIRIIAEGVETCEELKTLAHLGVQYAQGYLIQEPDTEIKEIKADVLQMIQEQNQYLQKYNRKGVFTVQTNHVHTAVDNTMKEKTALKYRAV